MLFAVPQVWMSNPLMHGLHAVPPSRMSRRLAGGGSVRNLQNRNYKDPLDGTMSLRRLLALQKLLHDSEDEHAEGMGAVQYVTAPSSALG